MDGELLIPYWDHDKVSLLTAEFVRDIRNHGKSEKWIQFAFLPNVPGQKYTLGSKFMPGVEGQGEFILLPEKIIRPEHSRQGIGCFEIILQKNKFILYPGQDCRKTIIFVNGSRVWKKRVLSHGSKLSIGNQKHPFLFQTVRRDCAVTNNMFKSTTKLRTATTPGQNELIVSKILSFLPIPEIQNARFVSSLWNAEAVKLLRKRCCIHLNLTGGYNNPHTSMKLFRYSLEMSSFPLLAWKLELPCLGACDEFGMKFKMVTDLSSFLLQPHSITLLELGGLMDSLKDYSIRHKILAKLSQTLEHIELSGYWGWEPERVLVPYNLHFPRLKTLTLSLRGRVRARDNSWFRGWIPGIKTVTWIRLNCDGNESHAFLYCLSNAPWSLFRHLRKFTSHVTTPTGLRCLSLLEQKLTWVELGLLVEMRAGDYAIFEKFLVKHAATLEMLQFVMCAIKVRDEKLVITVKIPSCPKLRWLNIGKDLGLIRPRYPEEPDLHWYVVNSGRNQEINLNFPGGEINYARDFPVLESLTLWPMGFGKYPLEEDAHHFVGYSVTELWNKIEPFYAIFCPGIVTNFVGQPQIVRSVLDLDILTHASFGNVEKKLLLSENAVTRIADMFPNLRNKDTTVKDLPEEEKVSQEFNPMISDSFWKRFKTTVNQIFGKKIG